jgi:hypothetical protein
MSKVIHIKWFPVLGSVRLDYRPKFGKSIREKSIEYFSDSKFCRLSSGHPKLQIKYFFLQLLREKKLIFFPYILITLKNFYFNIRE